MCHVIRRGSFARPTAIRPPFGCHLMTDGDTGAARLERDRSRRSEDERARGAPPPRVTVVLPSYVYEVAEVERGATTFKREANASFRFGSVRFVSIRFAFFSSRPPSAVFAYRIHLDCDIITGSQKMDSQTAHSNASDQRCAPKNIRSDGEDGDGCALAHDFGFFSVHIDGRTQRRDLLPRATRMHRKKSE